ncbi:MAG: glycosyltransferase [Leptospiraceae bacterium]|jgi:glycosyltransferase involved in cell wall biosynthesis|nr:glycosyltransferase [Leptospiraceae bacterium]
MKVVKIIHGYPPLFNAGSEVYSQTLCNELSKDNEVHVFTREENPYYPDFHLRLENISHNLIIHFINIPRGKDGYRHKEMDIVFHAFLQEVKPDIAHIGHLNHLSTGFVDILYENKIPIVYTLHDFWLMCPRGQFLQTNFGNRDYYQLCDKQEDRKCATNCYNAYFSGREDSLEREIENWTDWISLRMKEMHTLCEKVAIFISPSHYLKDRFVKEFSIPEEKIQLLDYGFHLERFKKFSTYKLKTFTFGYIGTHIPAKGVNLLLDAFLKIKESAVLKIWGRDNGQSTAALKEKAKLSKNEIEFLGEYNNENIAKSVFADIDCLVVPSIWTENSPLVIHEAQQSKIPIITADVGGMKEFVEDNVNGLLFRHRNVNSLKDKMEFAATHPEQMIQFGQKGYLYSDTGDIVSIETHTMEILEIYNRAINNV